jgi:tRNA (cmo5U34)-methyltransferase
LTNSDPSSAPSSLGHFPDGGWTFDVEVSRVFDDMLARSVPQYETMRRLVRDVGLRFARPGTQIVDLGCSHGESLLPLVAGLGRSVRYVGVEVSQPMLDEARRRFQDEIDCGSLELLDLDLRDGYPRGDASLTLSVLTLQFVPIEYRSRIVQDVYDHTLPGGAFILVEKVLGVSARTDGLLTGLYDAVKRSNGYSRDEIDRKRLSLEGVLVPVTADWNEEFLRRAGFLDVECFWRCLNFAAWVAIKNPRA